MIGRRSSSSHQDDVVEPKGFDDFELRLGDVMRGERATMGKSLLDVQRELRIKATYIAAIENCDPEAFDTPGFIAGYVRSYARYLNMDPDKAFAGFCQESGFQVAHGMSAEASSMRKPSREERVKAREREGRDIFAAPATPFVPTRHPKSYNDGRPKTDESGLQIGSPKHGDRTGGHRFHPRSDRADRGHRVRRLDGAQGSSEGSGRAG